MIQSLMAYTPIPTPVFIPINSGDSGSSSPEAIKFLFALYLAFVLVLVICNVVRFIIIRKIEFPDNLSLLWLLNALALVFTAIISLCWIAFEISKFF